MPAGTVVHSGRRGTDGKLAEVHWPAKAKGRKGKAVKVWNSVVVGVPSEAEEEPEVEA